MKLAIAGLVLAVAEKSEDLVTSLPGFKEQWPFKLYSGFLKVPGPVAGYDELSIHYQFHTSQNDPTKDPIATWHQGGPGGSSITIGLYGELGAFIVGEEENYLNPWAWNKFANMLFLESPAGSGGNSGYSTCMKGGKTVDCSWNDVNQGEAYAHTLQAFFKAFPEFKTNDLYMTGESYFGQYGPNIANYIVNTAPFSTELNLKGLALGNACWGGNETLVACNGPSQDKINVDLYYGKALYSPKLHASIEKECDFPTTYVTGDDDPSGNAGRAALSAKCVALLKQMSSEVGPHNIYFIYDNCPDTQKMLDRTGKDMEWLHSYLSKNRHSPRVARDEITKMNGGYSWDCMGDSDKYITRADVRKALHLDTVEPGASGFNYDSAGPASVTIYPSLAQKVRLLIYNGDSDACVPYNGNEEWIGGLEDQGVLKQSKAWTPWYTSNKATPAGYLTKYSVPGSDKDFAFQTVRLAGHMVPQFQPEAASVMIKAFLQGSKVSADTQLV
mmetsp:Transcript_47126/g.102529  ORF Transcript_47126/g.102529 Transcript_47126/m.102529 type:complete len:500 (-) Transcript_47126:117-1616(-)